MSAMKRCRTCSFCLNGMRLGHASSDASLNSKPATRALKFVAQPSNQVVSCFMGAMRPSSVKEDQHHCLIATNFYMYYMNLNDNG